MDSRAYEFTSDWFSHVAATWERLLEVANPSKVLEIGCYEGRSTCFLVESIGARRSYDIFCVDPWARSASHDVEMDRVEKRFDANVALASGKAANRGQVTKRKGSSLEVLPGMLLECWSDGDVPACELVSHQLLHS